MNKDQLIQAAQRALLYEVTVNPKPGLVDPVNQGAHNDMDVYTFIDSATSLIPYFTAAVDLGRGFHTGPLTELFEQLRQEGIQAERVMFEATHGVNTHKGAIFSLGILVCATAYLQVQCLACTSENLAQIVKDMLLGLSANDFARIKSKSEKSLTAGEQQFLKYGATGIRGQAEAGFPVVMDLALPFLKKTSGNLNGRLLDTLMMISSKTDDSNLIKRAGTMEILPWWQKQVDHYFELGGSQTSAGLTFIQELNQICIEQHLSIGGSADLLILTIFVGMVTEVI